MDKELIRGAAEKLELMDIFIEEAHLSRNGDMDPTLCPDDFHQQTKLGVNAEQLTYGPKKGEPIRVLRIHVMLGVRAVPCEDDAPKREIDEKAYFAIEATFVADYLATGDDLSRDEVDEFSRFNAVHNVWPFWRQHVFSVVQMARLPRVNIPLFKGRKLAAPKSEKETTRVARKRKPKAAVKRAAKSAES